jgi:hypothetical protein
MEDFEIFFYSILLKIMFLILWEVYLQKGFLIHD